LIALVLNAGTTQAQSTEPSPPTPPIEPFELPDLAASVTQLLNQVYLTEVERARIRVNHGVWEPEDITEIAPRARAALTRGALDDAALTDPTAPEEDRAEALLRRGEPDAVLHLLAGRENARATRLRGDALVDLGRTREAEAEFETLIPRLTDSVDAEEVSEAARAALALARIRGAESKDAVGYQPLLNALARARDQLDRLSWRASLAEAMLLYEKDKYADVGQALETVLTLNPRCADAWALLGQAAVDGFDFPRAEAIAARLDDLAGGPSIDGAALRAAIRLRLSEGDAAERELSPLLQRYPKHRRLRALWAASAGARFDFAAADARLTEFDHLAPGSPVGALAVGRAMASARQYDEAAKYLRTASKLAPNWAEPVVELGLSELQAGRNDASLEALETATRLDKYNVRAANSLTLLRELQTYATIESDHFVLRYKPGDDEILAKEMLAPLERIYTRVTGNGPGGIDHAPGHKTVVELYPNHRWFSVRITGMPALHTIAAATGPVIAMEAPRTGPGHKVGAFDWARVVQHEYTHTVTLSRTKNRLPHWFTEASAVYLEDAPRDFSTVQLLTRALETDTLFDLDAINIAFVRPKRPSDRAQAYAQGAWMYEFLIDRWGPRTPLTLMDLYASGAREEEAFKKVVGLTRMEFLTHFRAWATEQAEAWGMTASDRAPGIPALLAAASAESPTPELIEQWLTSHPDNPFVLELKLDQEVEANKGKISAEHIDLCERYARARPVDPRPHRLLAALYLAGGGESVGRGREAAIPHLEYLDIREQHSAGYAIELARRYMAIDEMSKAMVKGERASQIAPYDAKVREFAATVAIKASDLATAERHIRALIVLEPDRPVHKERLEALLAMRAK